MVRATVPVYARWKPPSARRKSAEQTLRPERSGGAIWNGHGEGSGGTLPDACLRVWLTQGFAILSEAHLRRLLGRYRAYYNSSRPHQALENNSPIPRDVQPPLCGHIQAVAEVWGLHHRYQRVA